MKITINEENRKDPENLTDEDWLEWQKLYESIIKPILPSDEINLKIED